MSEPQALRELLDSGASLDDVFNALRPAGEVAALERLAVVRAFDPEIYDLVTEDISDAPPLAQLAAAGPLEALPRTGLYRLTAGARREQLAAGESFPELSRRLVELYEARGEAIEALYHQVPLDADGAVARFQELFARADEQFDLNRCHDLLDALTERLALLEARHCAILDDHERYLAARGQWVEDWYRTARFVGSQADVAALERLLEGGDGRALALWARGGMGKTMHLRWFIARHCVPRPARIPCARIDFDFVDARTAAREPWLLLLEMAAQLDPQLSLGPLGELLVQYGHHRERLDLWADRPDAASTTGDATPTMLAADAVEDLRERFASTLRALPPDEPVLLVLDTLEVALLPGGRERGQTDLEPLLRELALVHDAAPCVRLLLAGRYSLAERTPCLAELLPDAAHLQLTEFDTETVGDYLLDARRLDRPDLVDAVHEASGGVPLKVAMIADVIDQEPGIAVREVREYTDVDLLYLVQRVLRPIDPALRWLVRYGAIPRRLDLELLRDVIHPRLCAAIAGESADDPTGDPHGEADLYPEGVAVPDPDDLWASLKLYAGYASWVSAAPGALDAVQFHPEVVRPMRRVLGGGSVAKELHRDAAAFFERRAGRDPLHAGHWASEVVYHRFQLEGSAAVEHWREWIARLEDDPGARHVLAADLLGGDYVEDGEVLPWPGGRRILSPDTLLQARYQLALAAIHRARISGAPAANSDWLEARDAIADIEHLQRGRRRPAVSASRIALIRAHLWLVADNLDRAEPEIATASRGRLTARERFSLDLAHADALAFAGREAAPVYGKALRLAPRLPEPERRRTVVLRRLAAHHRERDRLAEAETTLGRLGPAAAADPEVTLDRADITLLSGQPHAAADLALALVDGGDAISVRARLLVGRAHLLLGDADAALSFIQENDVWFAREGEAQQLAAARLALKGEALGRRLEIAEASRRLQEAASLFASVPDAQGVCRVNTKAAEIELRIAGDLTAARASLDHARRANPPILSDELVDMMLMDAELMRAAGRSDDARAMIDNTWSHAAREARPPSVLARIAMAGLALGRADTANRYLEALLAVLTRVTPPRARLALLEPLQRCPALGEVQMYTRVRLRHSVPSPVDDPNAFADTMPDDLARLRLLDAELRRVIGDPLASAEAATEAIDMLGALVGHTWPAGAALGGAVDLAIQAGARSLARFSERAAARLREKRDLQVAAVLVDAVLASAQHDILDPAQRAELLDALLLLEGTQDGRVWVARASERLARDAAARREDPSKLAERAAAIYGELGDAVARERALKLAGPAAEPESADAAGVSARVRLDRDTQTIDLVQDGVPGTRVATHPEIGWALGQLVSGGSSEAAAWGRVARLLISDSELLMALPDVPSLALAAEPPVLHALPWELRARPEARLYRSPAQLAPASPVRNAQRALSDLGHPVPVDDIAGPATAAALRAFQERSGLPVTGEPDAETMRGLLAALTGGERPQVLVMSPEEHATKQARRGFALSGAAPEDAYMAAGYRVAVVHAASGEALNRALDTARVAIVHLCCGFIDAHGTPALNLTPTAYVSRGEVLYSTTFDKMLYNAVPRPLVVLDVPRPPAEDEAVVQLLLRNAFAGDLIGSASSGPVLATGLVEPWEQAELYTRLTEALGQPLVSVGAKLRTTLPGARATAVFTRDPGWLTPVVR